MFFELYLIIILELEGKPPEPVIIEKYSSITTCKRELEKLEALRPKYELQCMAIKSNEFPA
jgi:hypothetical protein